MEDEFYVGYEPSMPPAMATSVRRAAAALLALAAVIAGTLIASQERSSSGEFEYGRPRTVEGWVVERPYPALEVVDARGERGWYWLVGPGKHGAAELVAGREGRRVRLSGTLIEREGDRMIEVVPGSLVTTSSGVRTPAPIRTVAGVTLTGEIVDSKCHLGVMKPGEGPTHRDCAVRCLLGRIPPMLSTQEDGRHRRVPIVVADRDRFEAALPSLAGRPVRIRGTLLEREGRHFLLTAVHEIAVQ